jgi:hypothetical protein
MFTQLEQADNNQVTPLYRSSPHTGDNTATGHHTQLQRQVDITHLPSHLAIEIQCNLKKDRQK